MKTIARCTQERTLEIQCDKCGAKFTADYSTDRER
jgi:hypothetical protein